MRSGMVLFLFIICCTHLVDDFGFGCPTQQLLLIAISCRWLVGDLEPRQYLVFGLFKYDLQVFC